MKKHSKLTHSKRTQPDLAYRQGADARRYACKMIRLVFITFIASTSLAVLAEQEPIELGDRPEKIIEIKCEPTETKELKIKDKTFITYYYRNSNLSYVVDKNQNIVCELSLGRTEGYCYPCDYGPTAGTCP